MKNSEGHPACTVSQPPSHGPMVGASIAMTPAMPVATGSSRGPNSRKTALNTLGMITPPNRPCTVRATISMANPVLSPQAAEATVNPASATTIVRRRPSARIINPDSGIEITSAVK